MTGRILTRAPPVDRRRPLLSPESAKAGRRRCGEVVGGATAECAAVCCCCPFTVMEILYLGLYKVPTGLCRKALRRRRRKRLVRKGTGLLAAQRSENGPTSRSELEIMDLNLMSAAAEGSVGYGGDSALVVDDMEMWGRFDFGAGFWRSPDEEEEEDDDE